MPLQPAPTLQAPTWGTALQITGTICARIGAVKTPIVEVPSHFTLGRMRLMHHTYVHPWIQLLDRGFWRIFSGLSCYFILMSILPVCTMCMQCLWRPEDGIKSPRATINGCATMWMLGIEASSNPRPHFSTSSCAGVAPSSWASELIFLSDPCCGSAETWSDRTIPLNSLFAPHIHLLSSSASRSVRPSAHTCSRGPQPAASVPAQPRYSSCPVQWMHFCVPNPTLSFINVARAKFSCLFLISTKFYIYYNLHTSPLPNFIVI